MHMIFRTLWAFLTKPFLAKSTMGEMTEISMRVMPTDLDYLWHVNNGVYFSLMDFGRWNMIFRNGVFDECVRRGWYSVVAAETIKFRKSLELWDKFTLQTQILGHDEKYFFIQQKFLRHGELMATGLVKVRFLKRAGGTVGTEEVLREMKTSLDTNVEDLSGEWMAMESKYFR